MAGRAKTSRPDTKAKGVALKWGGSQYLHLAAYLLLAALILVPPFFRGLFFPAEQLWAAIAAAVLVFLVWQWKFSKRELLVFSSPADYFALALFIFYLLSIFTAAEERLAVQEVIKLFLYLGVYWSAAQLAKHEKGGEGIFGLVYLAGLAVALAGILIALGVISYKDGFVGGRIFSTLQYPNALAVYVGAAFIAGLYFWATSGKYSLLIAMGNYTLLLVFLGTNSRGAFLIFPVITFLFWLGSGEKRGALFGHLAITLTAALIGSYRFIPSLLEKNTTAALIWLGLGLAAALAGELLLSFFLRSKVKHKPLWLGGIVLLALVFGMSFLWFIGETGPEVPWWQRILPEQISARLTDINLETSSSANRIYWSQDAWKMIKDHPVLGLGGGAWEAAYRAYQGFLYHSTQVHNHWLQIWLESGTLGFVAWLGLWASFLWAAVKRRFQQGDFRAWSVAAAASVIGAHAVIDFDLALGAVSIMLYCLLGLGSAMASDTREMQELSMKQFAAKKKTWQAGTAVLSLVVILAAGSLLLAQNYAAAAGEAINHNQRNIGLSNLEKAAAFDPFEARYRMDLARLYLADNPAKGLAYAEAAVKKSPYDYELAMALSQIYLQTGRFSEAQAAMEQAVRNYPWNVVAWDNLTRVYTYAGLAALERSDRAGAADFLDQALRTPARMAEKLETLGEREKDLWPEWESFQPSADLKLHLGIASYLSGNLAEARQVFEQHLDNESTRADALLWLAVLETQGLGGGYVEELAREFPDRLAELQNLSRLEPLE